MILNMVGSCGSKINGIIEQYKVQAGNNISAGDFVQFLTADWGTATQLSTLKGNPNYRCFCPVLIDNTKAVLFFYAIPNGSSSVYIHGVVISFSGSVITSGTPVKLSSTSINAPETYRGISAVKLSSTKIFLAFNQTTGYGDDLRCEIVTVSGTTLSNGASVNVAYVKAVQVVALSSTTVAVVYGYPSVMIKIATVNGTSITLSSQTTIFSSSVLQIFSVGKLSSTKLLISYVSGTGSDGVAMVVVLTINSTTVSVGTSLVLKAGYINNSGQFPVIVLSETSAVVFYRYGNYSPIGKYIDYCAYLTVNGTTITKNGETILTEGLTGTLDAISGYAIDSNHIYLLCGKAYNPYELEIEIINNTPILISDKALSQGLYFDGVFIDLLDDIVFACFPTASGSAGTPPSGMIRNITPTAIAYSNVINGVAKTAGSGGSTIDVYVPNT